MAKVIRVRSSEISSDSTTYDAVVLAADGSGGARVAGADTNDSNRGAGQTDKDIEVGQDDAQETKKRGHAFGRGLWITAISALLE